MKELNDYMFNVFTLMNRAHQTGLLAKPRVLKIFRKDKKILNNIYKIYNIHNAGLSVKNYINLCREHSVNTGQNIIKAGQEMAETIEKTIIK